MLLALVGHDEVALYMPNQTGARVSEVLQTLYNYDPSLQIYFLEHNRVFIQRYVTFWGSRETE